jgi:hypothetical protein
MMMEQSTRKRDALQLGEYRESERGKTSDRRTQTGTHTDFRHARREKDTHFR